MENELVGLSKDLVFIIIDTLAEVPYSQSAPVINRIIAEGGSQLIEESDAPQIIT